jgi:hypothetical protein
MKPHWPAHHRAFLNGQQLDEHDRLCDCLKGEAGAPRASLLQSARKRARTLRMLVCFRMRFRCFANVRCPPSHQFSRSLLFFLPPSLPLSLGPVNLFYPSRCSSGHSAPPVPSIAPSPSSCCMHGVPVFLGITSTNDESALPPQLRSSRSDRAWACVSKSRCVGRAETLSSLTMRLSCCGQSLEVFGHS